MKKNINKIITTLAFASIAFGFSSFNINAKSLRNLVNSRNDSAMFLNPPPKAVFTSPAKGTVFDKNKISLTVDITPTNEALVNKDLQIILYVTDSPEIFGNEKASMESIEDSLRPVRFASKDEVKSLTFSDVTLFYPGKNYIGCFIGTVDANAFDFCGGFVYANLLEVDYTGNIFPLYRFYSEKKEGHFYTINHKERDSIDDNDFSWAYERISYYVTQLNSSGDCAGTGRSEVYRFYNPTVEHHFYTTNKAEKDELISKNKAWIYEGVGYCADISNVANALPVHRFYNPTTGGHFYTMSEAEKDGLIVGNPAWKYENIAYYAFK